MRAAVPVIVFAAALMGTLSARQPSDTDRALAITHVAVLDSAAGTMIPDVTVLIRGGRIVAVDRAAAIPDNADIVDGRNKFLVPGLWDMHVHLSYARASALASLVANGVTSVRDLGSDLGELDRWRAEIAANTRVGPSIVRAGPILNGQEFNRYQLTIANASDARMAVRTLKKVGVDTIKTHRRTPRDAYFAAADEARALGLPFCGHVPVTVPPEEAADARPTMIEHAETLFEGTFATAHAGQDLAQEIGKWRATDASQQLFAKFVRNNIAVDPTLIAAAYVNRIVGADRIDPRAMYIAASARRQADATLAGLRSGPPGTVRARQQLDVELIAVTGAMHRAGVALVTGTDTSFLHPPGFVVHEELELLVAAGLTPAEALRAATLNSARLFPSQDNGTIEPGKRADLVLLDANPLDDIRNTQRIGAVVLRGRMLNRQALDRLLEDAARVASIS